MFGSIASRYDLANSVMSFGTHYLWKRALVSALKEGRGERALDLCTGTGDLLPLLKKKFSFVVGADFCFPMMREGKGKSHLTSFPFVQADALQLPIKDNCFDALTVSFGVRNFENTLQGLKECHRVLSPKGTLAVLEFGQPSHKLWGALYAFYSKHLMPAIGGLLTGNRHAYTYLPETSANFPCGENFEALLKEAGFEVESTKSLFGGIAFIYVAKKLA